MVGRPNLRAKKGRHTLEKFEGESSVLDKSSVAIRSLRSASYGRKLTRKKRVKLGLDKASVRKRLLRSASSGKRHSPVKREKI